MRFDRVKRKDGNAIHLGRGRRLQAGDNLHACIYAIKEIEDPTR